jgi:hypothetical protein
MRLTLRLAPAESAFKAPRPLLTIVLSGFQVVFIIINISYELSEICRCFDSRPAPVLFAAIALINHPRMVVEALGPEWKNFEEALGDIVSHVPVRGTLSSAHNLGTSGYADAVAGVCCDSATALRALHCVLERISRELKHVVLPALKVNLDRCSTLADAELTTAFPTVVLQEAAVPILGWQRVVDGTVSMISETVKDLERWARAELLTARTNFQHAVGASVLSAVGKQLPGKFSRCTSSAAPVSSPARSTFDQLT